MQRRIAVCRRGSNGNVHQSIGEASAQLRVVFGSSQPGEQCHVADTIDRRRPDTRVRVRCGKLIDRAAMSGIVRDFG